MSNSDFNRNWDGIAPNCPCVPTCPNRNAYCRANCKPYKEWQIVQKHYSNKVKRIRKQMGGGIGWYQLRATFTEREDIK